MKNRTILRARAKSAAEVYADKHITDVLVMTYMQLLDQYGRRYTQHDYVAVFFNGDAVVDFDGFNLESDAVVFARDARKFLGLEACETRIVERSAA